VFAESGVVLNLRCDKQQAFAIGVLRCYGLFRARRGDLKALRQMISEAHDILRTTNLPERSTERAYDRQALRAARRRRNAFPTASAGLTR
jgi:hypothetical protein